MLLQRDFFGGGSGGILHNMYLSMFVFFVFFIQNWYLMGTYYTGILYCIGRYTKPGYLYYTGTGKRWIGASLRDLTMLSVLNINKKSKKKKKKKM